MKTILSLSLLFLFLGIANAQSLSGHIGNIRRGGQARGVLILEIPKGLHVNSNRPGNEYVIPTTVKLFSEEAILSKIYYPKGKNKRFSFNDEPINIYEGKTKFSFTVKVPRNFKGKIIRIRAVVRYQACNDEVCFPPREKEITLTAKVI
jgi:DsbC/DsbD-like thiol-disulfide interchange protein